MKHNQIELRWPRLRKQHQRQTGWLHNLFSVTEPLIPSTQQDMSPHSEPDVSTNRLPDCQPWTIRNAL
ncbi:MAG TPA: hypothetical protein VL461_09635 [Dictyobacter sp.]|nr:hypothetical protein [Dictyobacter sp.]